MVGTATMTGTGGSIQIRIAPHEVLARSFADEPGTLASLNRLKDLGVLRALDSSGKSLASHLIDLLPLKSGAIPGMASGKDLVSQIVADLANPATICQSTRTTTCTVASLQAILARAQAAEYVRLAGQLARKGRAELVGVRLACGIARGTGPVRLEDTCLVIHPRDFTSNEELNPLARAFQRSFIRLGRREEGATGLRTGDLTVEEFGRVHELVTSNRRVLVEADASVWLQFVTNRLEEASRDRVIETLVYLAPEPGHPAGSALVIERLFQMPDGTLVAHTLHPASSARRQVPVADFQPRVQLLELDAAEVSSSKIYLAQVARRQHP
ncbi:MAG: hypothetical protein VKP72_00010 [bacterium]|nr:hypothetical protein [bacterium]